MRFAFLTLIGLAALAASARCHADGVVDVTTRDGRALHGVVDARTDDERLWVRRDEGAISLSTSATWDDIVIVAIDGATVSVQTLRERGDEFASVTEPLSQRLNLSLAPRKVVPSNGLGQRSRVRSLEIVDACLVNLDQTVEPDGLIVSVAALDEQRRPRPVRGSLSVRLFGERRPNSAAIVEFGTLDTWSQPVAASDFVDGVATYELRFRRTAPEWQFDLLPDALIEVRLGAFGEGNFAASAPVVIRALNPLRDDRQLYDGTRFMPREWHGREPSSVPTREEGLWLNWPTWVR